MKKTVFELRNNKRVQQLHEKGAAPGIVSSLRENISFASGTNCPECGFCGAMLPHDVMFQKQHMLQVHGVTV